jgi:outer membrane immunogenic protein
MNVSDDLNAEGFGVTLNLVSASDTALGWTAGAGVEVALSPNWTARLEYLFLDVQPTLTASVPGFLGGGTITDTGTIKDSVVRAGVNFKFSPF